MIKLWRAFSDEGRNAYGHLCAEAFSAMDCSRGFDTFSTALIWNGDCFFSTVNWTYVHLASARK